MLLVYIALYKYTSQGSHVAAVASISKKQSAVLHDEEEVGEYVLLSESEDSLSYKWWQCWRWQYYSRLCLGEHAKL
jgi:hypothetical protein